MSKKSAISEYMSEIGRKGGRAKSAAKNEANRQRNIVRWAKKKSEDKSLKTIDLEKSL